MDVKIGENIVAAQQFAETIKSLMADASYESIAKLLTNVSQQQQIHAHLQETNEDLLRNVCLKNLDSQTFEQNPALYNCADEILKHLAYHVPSDNLLIELLELLEEMQEDYQFTTLLRALQALLLNFRGEKSKAYDWSFNTVRLCLEQLKLPKELSAGYDDDQAKLLEQNQLVEDLLARYITIGLFYGFLRDDILKLPEKATTFKDCSLKNRRNLLCCFLVQLLGKPLALLDLTVTDDRKTNSYTLQVARNLTHDINKLIVNPFYWLTHVEQRERWKRRLDSSKGVYEMSSNNVFLIDERLPLEGLAIYYYMLFSDPSMQYALHAAPKVYDPYFIVESCIYLVIRLLKQEPPLQLRGLQLAQRVIDIYMTQKRIPSTVLELKVHKVFFEQLCTIVGYSSQATLRRQGASLLKDYILLFDDEGRYLILRNIMPALSHKGLKSYLSTLYKDMVAKALHQIPNTDALPAEYSGKLFKEMLLNVICKLPKATETDLLDYAEQISAALNIVRYFALSDKKNRSGFWQFKEDIQNEFFEPLRKGLDYSVAHYKLEIQQVESNWGSQKQKAENARALAMEMLSVKINNNVNESFEEPETVNREGKLEFLNHSLTTFDLLRSLLARTMEIMEKI